MKRISVLLFITLALFAACSPKGGSCIIEGELEGMPGTGTIVLEGTPNTVAAVFEVG